MNYLSIPDPGSTPVKGSVQQLHRFTSFKTREAVFYRYRWCRDALIVSTLDPELDFIAPLPPNLASSLSSVICCAYVAKSRGRLRACIVVDDHHAASCGLECSGLPVDIVTRTQLLANPNRNSLKEIWSHRDHLVPIATRMRLLAKLSENLEGVRFVDLAAADGIGRDHFEAVLAMAATGDLTIDLEAGLRPDSLVHLIPPAQRLSPISTVR